MIKIKTYIKMFKKILFLLLGISIPFFVLAISEEDVKNLPKTLAHTQARAIFKNKSINLNGKRYKMKLSIYKKFNPQEKKYKGEYLVYCTMTFCTHGYYIFDSAGKQVARAFFQ